METGKINIEDFKKVEIRAGKIISAESVPNSEKLLKLSVDFGPAVAKAMVGKEERDIRQVFSGIAKFVKPEELVGVICGFVTNLEPRSIMGEVSEAMIMAASGDDYFSLMKFDQSVKLGSIVK